MLTVGEGENRESSPTEAMYIQWQNARYRETGENQEQRYENSQGDEQVKKTGTRAQVRNTKT